MVAYNRFFDGTQMGEEILDSRFAFFFLGVGATALAFLTVGPTHCSHSVAGRPPLPISYRELEKEGFWIGYDQRSKVAAWVYEELTPAMLDEVAARPSGYFVDRELSPFARADNEDYRNSGYTRGHLAASGNYAFNEEAREATNVYSNIAPQLEATNTRTIKKIEERVRGDVEGSKVTRVITGPIYEAQGDTLQIAVIGEGKVWVPTGFFKRWQIEYHSGDKETHALKLDHQPGAQPQEVSLEELERLTGVEFPF